jgi:hypothetical protein
MDLVDYLRCVGLRGTTQRNVGNAAADEIIRLRAAIALLERVLKVANSGHYRDGTGLSFGTQPLMDDVRGFLSEHYKTLSTADYAD